jgi:hypothetical protein
VSIMSDQSLVRSGLKTLTELQESEFREVLTTPPVNQVQSYLDRECDKHPDMDSWNDRDHFQADPITGIEPTDQEIDQVLAMFDNEYTNKTGRFEVPDPDGDPFNDEDDLEF